MDTHWNWTHGEARKGRRTREWRAWNAMIRRCTYPSMARYPRYGGRGIVVCDRWRHSFANFLTDMGRCPEGYQLDRIDNDGNYTPENCQWASRSEQIRNSGKARLITFNGQTKPLCVWSILLGLKRTTITQRIDAMGWSVEKALTTPVQKRSHG